MIKKLKLLAIASLCSAFIPSVAVANPEDFAQPAAAPLEEVKARSCAEATAFAEIIREMKRTDGDTNPELGDVPECNAERADA